ncbi:DUF445 domain-containing protein [Skermania sp. ID1734]|uniref:DUF445 domain-containing protein n=1 Tax=Skermania sp. ID1734 TaxID=2597516 RepID=UPI00117DC9B3|nr:DUF445 domain-containing protein [Skermania sp. ID1734]TSE01612.1 DUF445 domain-containing protein [Skermania sp. ID1734]
MQKILEDFLNDWRWIPYLSVIVIAGLIGYLTKLAAIEMMFKPIDYWGVHLGPIPLGWQGIIPLRAAHMTSVATNKIVGDLLTPAEIWSKLDPEVIMKEIREPLMDSLDAITQEVAVSVAPEIWGNMPGPVKDRLLVRVRERAPGAMQHVMEDVEANVEDVFDLKALTTRALVYDKRLLQRIFRKAGKQEWRFIRGFGGFAGLGIGVIQLVLYLILHVPLINPIMGALNGFLTDWFCIKFLLFEPKRPKKYFGLITWQGLFLKYQQEVAQELANIVADKVITADTVIDSIMRGPKSDRFFLIVEHHIGKLIEEELGFTAPAVKTVVGTANFAKIKAMMADRVMVSLPDTMHAASDYIEDTLDIRNTLAQRLAELPPEEFEGILRPAFHQDEWTLISTGAILGAVAGFLQDGVLMVAGISCFHLKCE